LILAFIGKEGEENEISLKEVIKGMLDLTKCTEFGAEEFFSGLKFESPGLMI
jgi:hypothetical protein